MWLKNYEKLWLKSVTSAAQKWSSSGLLINIMILPQSTEEMHPVTEINHSIEQLVFFYNKCTRIHDHLNLIDIEEFACLRYDEYFAEIDKHFKLFAKQYDHTRALILNSEKQLEPGF